jgi:hypothetical protein
MVFEIVHCFYRAGKSSVYLNIFAKIIYFPFQAFDSFGFIINKDNAEHGFGEFVIWLKLGKKRETFLLDFIIGLKNLITGRLSYVTGIYKLFFYSTGFTTNFEGLKFGSTIILPA